jgi:hypothetical protein
MKSFLIPLILFLCSTVPLKAQDLIVKINGDTIEAKLLEVGVTTVSYKKKSLPDGPTFVLDKAQIAVIKYSNGDTENFNTIPANSATTAAADTNTLGTSDQNQQTKNKIELVNNKYFINGQSAKKKEVDNYLGRSRNPAIQIGLKGAKGMSLAQKIVKITSYPTTIIGSVSSLVVWAEGYQLVQRGRATQRTFLNMGLNLIGMISLPITNKILTKKSNKMYGKLIDMYNVTN